MDEETLQTIKDLFIGLEEDSITTKEVERFLVLVLKTIKQSKYELDSVSRENIKKIEKMVSSIEQKASQIKSSISKEERTALREIVKIKEFLNEIKQIKASKGDDGYTPIKGVDYFDGDPGEPGKDGSPDNPDQLVENINKSGKKIDKDRIEGFRDIENNIKHGIYTGISEKRAIELIQLNSSSSGASFAAITGEPADNTNLAIALDSKADKTFAIAMAIALG